MKLVTTSFVKQKANLFILMADWMLQYKNECLWLVEMGPQYFKTKEPLVDESLGFCGSWIYKNNPIMLMGFKLALQTLQPLGQVLKFFLSFSDCDCGCGKTCAECDCKGCSCKGCKKWRKILPKVYFLFQFDYLNKKKFFAMLKM